MNSSSTTKTADSNDARTILAAEVSAFIIFVCTHKDFGLEVLKTGTTDDGTLFSLIESGPKGVAIRKAWQALTPAERAYYRLLAAVVGRNYESKKMPKLKEVNQTLTTVPVSQSYDLSQELGVKLPA